MHIGLLVRSKAYPRTWDFSGPPNAGHFEEQVRMLWMAHVSEGAQCCTTSTGSDSTASTTPATTTGADGKNANCMRRLYIDIEDVCVYYIYTHVLQSLSLPYPFETFYHLGTINKHHLLSGLLQMSGWCVRTNTIINLIQPSFGVNPYNLCLPHSLTKVCSKHIHLSFLKRRLWKIKMLVP